MEYNFLNNFYDDMYCCRWHKFTVKALLRISIFLYIWQWHVTQQKNTECILEFPWQQWFSKPATMLRNTCIAYLARLPLFCTYITHVTQTRDFRKSTTYSNRSLCNVAKCIPHHPASQPEKYKSSNLCTVNASAH